MMQTCSAMTQIEIGSLSQKKFYLTLFFICFAIHYDQNNFYCFFFIEIFNKQALEMYSNPITFIDFFVTETVRLEIFF
jgi:hypothetical protein